MFEEKPLALFGSAKYWMCDDNFNLKIHGSVSFPKNTKYKERVNDYYKATKVPLYLEFNHQENHSLI